MKPYVLLLGACLAGQAVAEERVYLMASVQLAGGSYGQTIFLHEPSITTLEGCEQARQQGIRDHDWQRYHHILMKDRMKGYSVQQQYRCVISEQRIDPWYDQYKYDHAYEVRVDSQSRLTLRRADSQASCSGTLRQRPAGEGELAFCTKGNQKLL